MHKKDWKELTLLLLALASVTVISTALLPIEAWHAWMMTGFVILAVRLRKKEPRPKAVQE